MTSGETTRVTTTDELEVSVDPPAAVSRLQLLWRLPARFEDFIDWQGKVPSAITLSVFFLILLAVYLRLSFVEAKNSDDAAFILYAQDILGGNITLHGWTLPADSLYLSVIPVYVIGALFTSNAPFLLYLIPAATYALLVMVSAVMVWTELPSRDRVAGALVVVLVIGFPSFLAAGPPTHSGGDHTTTIILTMLCFYLLAGDRNPVAAAIPLVLAAVGDPMVMVVGILPIVIVGGYCALMGEAWRGLRLGLFAFTAAIVSRLIVWAIPFLGGFHAPPQKVSFVALAQFKYNFYLFWEALTDLFGADFFGRDAMSVDTAFTLIHLIILLFVVCVVYRAAALWIRGETNVFLSLLVAGLMVDVLAFLFSSMAVDARARTARYLMPAVIFAALISGIAWYRLRVPRNYVAYAAPVLAGLCLIAFYRQVFRPIARTPDSVVEYLERNGLTHGYGDYWAAAIVTVLSRGKVTVRQVSPSAKRERLRPYNWESSDQWYNMNDARFLIFNPKDSLGVDAATGLNTWGDPQETKTLDGFHILIWAAPIHFSGRQ